MSFYFMPKCPVDIQLKSENWHIHFLMLLLLIFSLFQAEFVQASVIPFRPPVFHETEQLSFGGHVSPNEWNSQDAIQILKQAPVGTYLAVGSERGFMGAAVAKSSRLLLIDYDASVVTFNRLNIALLTIASSLEDYIFLRLRADHATWKSRVLSSGLDSLVLEPLKDERNWQLLRQTSSFLDNRSWRRFYSQFYEYSVEPAAPFFQGTHYMQDRELFNHLFQLAKSSMIEAHQVNLDEPVSRSSLFSQLKKLGIKISVIDLSNAWHDQYMNLDSLKSVLKAFNQLASSSRSILLLTNYPDAEKKNRFPQYASVWNYFGFTLQYLKKNYSETQMFWSSILKIYHDNFWRGSQPIGLADSLLGGSMSCRKAFDVRTFP